jgi:hypothetical protein
VHHHAIWRAGRGVNPPCRIGGGSDLAAPHKFGAFGPAQPPSPAGPPNQSLRRAQAPGWNVHPVDPVRVGPVDNLAVRLVPRGNDQRAGGISLGQFSHPTGDPTSHGWEIEGQEEVLAHT